MRANVSLGGREEDRFCCCWSQSACLGAVTGPKVPAWAVTGPKVPAWGQ